MYRRDALRRCAAARGARGVSLRRPNLRAENKGFPSGDASATDLDLLRMIFPEYNAVIRPTSSYPPDSTRDGLSSARIAKTENRRNAE
jgi:hypothetical protein